MILRLSYLNIKISNLYWSSIIDSNFENDKNLLKSTRGSNGFADTASKPGTTFNSANSPTACLIKGVAQPYTEKSGNF